MKIINIESGLDKSAVPGGSAAPTHATAATQPEPKVTLATHSNIKVKNLDILDNNLELLTTPHCSSCSAANTQEEKTLRHAAGGSDDLYLQITKGTGASFTENKIKIEKTIKSMCGGSYAAHLLVSPSEEQKDTLHNTHLPNNSSEKRWEVYLNSLQASVNSNPVDILYFNNNLNRPIINQYLKSMSIYNMITNGTMMYYSKFIGFNLFSLTPSTSQAGMLGSSGYRAAAEMQTNKLIKNIYKFLYSSFRSMYCLISKPVFIFKANKIIIQLFYFILIPKILKYKNKKEFYYYKNKNEKGKTNNILKLNKIKKKGSTGRSAVGGNYTVFKKK